MEKLCKDTEKQLCKYIKYKLPTQATKKQLSIESMEEKLRTKAPYYIHEWTQLKKEIDSWCALIENWAIVAKARNNAAHGSGSLGKKESVEEIRSALNELSNKGVFRDLNEIKKEMQGRKRFEQIATLAGLKSDQTRVAIFHSMEEPKRHLVKKLHLAGLCDKRDASKHDFCGHDQVLDSPQYPSEISIVDVLGEYYSDTKTIVIYDKLCEIAANVLKDAIRVDAEMLKQVVEIHEIAHAVTHIGRDADDGIWEYFELAGSEVKEFFAQAYSMKYYQSKNDEIHMKILAELSKHQDDRYNLWQEWTDRPLNGLNDKLLEARRTRPQLPALRMDFVLDGRELSVVDGDVCLQIEDDQCTLGTLRGSDLAALHASIRRLRDVPLGDGNKSNVEPNVTVQLGAECLSWHFDEANIGDGCSLLKRMMESIAAIVSELESKVVIVPDKHLRRQIQIALNKNKKVLPTFGEMVELRALGNTRFCGIQDLSGLNYANELTSLDLAHNSIQNISPLVNLRKLTHLDLEFNPIEDISSLSGLGKLEKLNLNLYGVHTKEWRRDMPRQDMPVVDISPLTSLRKLTWLGLVGVGVRDIRPLSALTELKELDLRGNHVENISPLANLKKLVCLDISNKPGGMLGHNEIVDISPLAELADLRKLNLGGSGVRDISPLAMLTELTELDLNGCPVEDISPLSNLRKLIRLDLRNTKIRDTSPLVELTGLTLLRQ